MGRPGANIRAFRSDTAATAPREQDIVRACLDLLRFRGIFAWRQNCGAVVQDRRGRRERFVRFTSIKGVSDIIAVLPGGRVAVIECKRPGNVPTEEQKAFLNAVTRRGGLAAWRWSSTTSTTSATSSIARCKSFLKFRTEPDENVSRRRSIGGRSLWESLPAVVEFRPGIHE